MATFFYRSFLSPDIFFTFSSFKISECFLRKILVTDCNKDFSDK